jgi:hypothetical protein
MPPTTPTLPQEPRTTTTPATSPQPTTTPTPAGPRTTTQAASLPAPATPVRAGEPPQRWRRLWRRHHRSGRRRLRQAKLASRPGRLSQRSRPRRRRSENGEKPCAQVSASESESAAVAMAAAARADGFLVAVMNIEHLAILNRCACAPQHDSVAGHIESEKIYQNVPGIFLVYEKGTRKVYTRYIPHICFSPGKSYTWYTPGIYFLLSYDRYIPGISHIHGPGRHWHIPGIYQVYPRKSQLLGIPDETVTTAQGLPVAQCGPGQDNVKPQRPWACSLF